MWYSISRPDAEKRFYALADGAAQPNMSGRQIENTELIIPPLGLLRKFNAVICPVSDFIDNMILRNRTLRQTRDVLLPKLISGELDVSDLDIHVREAA